MLPEAQLANFWNSFWAYVDSNYTLTAKYIADFNSMDTTSLQEWVEFRWQSSSPAFFARHADNVHPGEVVNAIVTAGIFVKPTDVIGRIVTIRDAVVDLLRRPLISVLNWSGSKEIIGELQGDGLISDVSVPIQDDLNKWTLAFLFRYQNKYERVRA